MNNFGEPQVDAYAAGTHILLTNVGPSALDGTHSIVLAPPGDDSGLPLHHTLRSHALGLQSVRKEATTFSARDT